MSRHSPPGRTLIWGPISVVGTFSEAHPRIHDSSSIMFKAPPYDAEETSQIMIDGEGSLTCWWIFFVFVGFCLVSKRPFTIFVSCLIQSSSMQTAVREILPRERERKSADKNEEIWCNVDLVKLSQTSPACYYLKTIHVKTEEKFES
jgi:hypothetical protein